MLHSTGSRRLAWLIIAVMLPVVAACADDDDDDKEPEPTATPAATATSTPRPIPPAVTVSPEPQGIGLTDPKFDALDGATAYYGRLGGSVYRIEIPDSWDGKTLALYAHGIRVLEPEARVDDPPFRRYLIRTGVAWAASSFSSTSLIPGRGADETAALWDEFVRRFGRPERTYVFGESMGGAASLISAEKYANRYDGALALCTFAGQSKITEFMGDFFAAGAFVAGVTQADYDATEGDLTGNVLSSIFNERIIPTLDDPQSHRLFEDILIAMTGGPRAFDRLGVAFEENANWPRVSIFVAARIAHNIDRDYEFASVAGVTMEEFNERVVRVPPDPERAPAFIEGNEITGRIEIPVLTVHITGDFYVPFNNAQEIRRKVEAAGRGDLLAQVAVQGPRHCGFARSEWERGFEMLRAWVEEDRKPESDDVFAADLARVGESFTEIPRQGSAAGDSVAGASDRVTVSGTVTVDGTPLDGGTFWFAVLNDGLWHACSFEGVRPARGRYERVIVAETEVTGCGEPGAPMAALTIKDGRALAVETSWPETSSSMFNVAFVTGDDQPSAAAFTRVDGAVLGRDGVLLPAGTSVEAYVGDTLCGRTSIPRVMMQFGAPDEFALFVAGPAVRAGCDADAELRFEVDGEPVAGTVTNRLDGRAYEIDLTTR